PRSWWLISFLVGVSMALILLPFGTLPMLGGLAGGTAVAAVVASAYQNFIRTHRCLAGPGGVRGGAGREQPEAAPSRFAEATTWTTGRPGVGAAGFHARHGAGSARRGRPTAGATARTDVGVRRPPFPGGRGVRTGPGPVCRSGYARGRR
ncbi:hypothetical protein ACFPN6_29670, partial [Streptomyces fimbriatus]